MTSQSSIANLINSVVKQSDSQSASPEVLSAIKKAASKTGVDFSYLLQKASQESGFDPTAKASTSSASGLFQFTSQTWLQMVKQYGAQYGLGDYARQISADQNGHLSVSDPATKQTILGLRSDPQISAEMAGELDKQNAQSLQQTVGGRIGGTELYLAHFLGASGASDFLSQMRSSSTTTAAAVLPEAAAANPSVFYNKTGQALSLGQIYQHFAQKFNSSNTQVASLDSQTTPKSASATSLGIQMASASPQMSQIAPSSVSGIGLQALGMTQTSLSGASTLFNAMVLGQLNNGTLNASSAIDAIGEVNDKKKNAMAVLSAVA